MPERTLVLLKPDTVRRFLVGELIGRIESKAGWRISALELRTLSRTVLEQHYAEHAGKPFYEPLVEFMASGPSVLMVVEGERVIEGVRALAGPTDPIALNFWLVCRANKSDFSWMLKYLVSPLQPPVIRRTIAGTPKMCPTVAHDATQTTVICVNGPVVPRRL